MTIYLNGTKVSGHAAMAHFIEWCLSLENEHEPVAHCSLDAISDFQRGVYGGDMAKRAALSRAGIEVR